MTSQLSLAHEIPTEPTGPFTAAPVLVSIPRIPTEADRRRKTLRFRLAAVTAMLGLALVASASFYVARGNERLVRILDQDRLT